MARKDSKDLGCPVHSRAMTPRGVSLAPVLQAASLLAPYVGTLPLFSLGCRSCLLLHPTFDLLILPCLCICFCAPLQFLTSLFCQRPLPSSALVSSSAHLPQSLVSSCSSSGQELVGPFPTSVAANCPQGTAAVPGDREGWLLICKGRVLPAPAPAHPSTSLCITSSGERLQPAKGDLLTETYLTTDTYFPWDIFFPYSPDFLTDKEFLASPWAGSSGSSCSGKQKCGITGANSSLWVQKQCTRQEHASVL